MNEFKPVNELRYIELSEEQRLCLKLGYKKWEKTAKGGQQSPCHADLIQMGFEILRESSRAK